MKELSFVQRVRSKFKKCEVFEILQKTIKIRRLHENPLLVVPIQELTDCIAGHLSREDADRIRDKLYEWVDIEIENGHSLGFGCCFQICGRNRETFLGGGDSRDKL